MAVETFVQRTLGLLDKERDAEIEETRFLNEKLSAKELERRGVCLLKLQLKSRRTGLYGRTVAVFEPASKLSRKDAKIELPSHSLTPGDIVGVGFMKGEVTDKPLATGIVSQVTTSNISVAFDESQDVFDLGDDELFKLTKLANDVTYRRLKTTLNDLAKYRGGPAQRLIDTLFNLEELSSPSGEFPITFVNESLDESQKEAVRFALTQREVAIIHGPPGTGKTTTVVELIIQAVRQGLKVLASASSNIAVDNLVERLANYKQKIVRIGHPARLLTHLQKYSLDAIVSGSEETGIVKDVKSDLQKVLAKLKKAKSYGERQALKQEMRELRKETTKREEAATKEVLSRADVVLVTLTSATDDGPLKFLQKSHFDLIVIDECSQALEAACWIGLLRAPRCVLAGDHLQLPPTILSKEAATSGLEITLMERLLKTLVEEKEKDVMRMLTVQYRMHQDIMMWSSQQLYQGRLTAHTSVASHLLRDLDGMSMSDETSAPLLIVDTTGCDLFELDLPEEVSKGNEGEADIVAAHVEDLIKCGVRPVDIAVIAPYNLQVELLRLRLSSQYPDLEIKSVDGFQGREKEAVVISMVRSNKTGEVGFLAEKRRINVAVTRARRHLAVVCDIETVSHDPFIKSLVDYMTEKGELLSAHQYIQDGKVTSVSSRPARLAALVESLEPKKSSNNKKAATLKQEKFNPQNVLGKEEKMKVYQEQLHRFVLDSNQTVLHFPATLNSHDRMVIHEVAEKLGLVHISTGEGQDRHIQVSKEKVTGDDKQSSQKILTEKQAHNSINVSALKASIHESAETVATGELHNVQQTDERVSAESSNCTFAGEQEQSLTSVGEQEMSLTSAGKQEQSLTSAGKQEQSLNSVNKLPEIKDLSLTGHSDAQSIKSHKKKGKKNHKPDVCPLETVEVKPLNTAVCRHCNKSILYDNLTMHELHCLKQRQPTSSAGMHQETVVGGIPKKEDKPQEKKKEKPKKSHVQKAADVLSKVDDDDFEGLIAKITELDSKCAFKKCKILTGTLGRNCEYCTRRFCLAHLMPEVHGCGDAAKSAARRLISRDGVLYGGSGVPNKKPSQARRIQLESKMEKKLGELAGKRSRNV